MRTITRTAALLAVAAIAAPATTVGSPAAAQSGPTPFEAAVARVLSLPYDPAYTPRGLDTAFDGDDYPSAFALTDTSTGTCCTGPTLDQPALADLAPPFAEFPDGFELVELSSADGTPLHAYADITPGAPGVVVMHGFNSNGKHSVVRYGAFLAANGYSVIVPDHRDLGREWSRGGSWNPDGTRHGQTLGWKEAEDLLAAAAYLRDGNATGVGVLGLSEGAQNTMIALGIDHDRLIDAVLTFSGPADQATQIARNGPGTAALLTTVVGEPDVCAYLTRVGQGPEFRATPNFILGRDSAIAMFDDRLGSGVDDVPGLHFYAQDDVLVPDWHATILASRTNTMERHETVLIRSGNHAYFTDRWWTQMAALNWFDVWLDTAQVTTIEPTVTPSLAGLRLSEQTVALSDVTREEGDAELRDHHLCAEATEPVGPTAMLSSSQAEQKVRFDGRRSYSGWDDHRIASWILEPGDGTASVAGEDPREALVRHVYRPGTYTATLTVVDDTGREHASTVEVTVAPGGSTPTAPAVEPVGGAGDDRPELPSTGGSLSLLGLATLAGASGLMRSR